MKEFKGTSVKISADANSYLDKMINELSSSEVTLNKSNLSSWIIERFFNRYYQGNKKSIVKFHQNHKKQFQNILTTLSEEELAAALKAVNKERYKSKN
jgi:hypothetical protein